MISKKVTIPNKHAREVRLKSVVSNLVRKCKVYVPNDLVLLIVKYSFVEDYFDTKLKAKKWDIKEDTISLGKNSSGVGSVLLTSVFNSGTHYWKFEVEKVNSFHSQSFNALVFEIVTVKDIKTRINDWCRGYGVMVYPKYLYTIGFERHNSAVWTLKSLFHLEENSIIEIKLDFNTSLMEFLVNGTNYGDCIRSQKPIKKNKYKLCIFANSGFGIKIKYIQSFHSELAEL